MLFDKAAPVKKSASSNDKNTVNNKRSEDNQTPSDIDKGESANNE